MDGHCFHGHHYFETSALLIAFVLLGKYLEARAKELRNKKKQDEMNAKKAGEGGDEEKAVPWENKVKEVEEEFWAAIQASDAKE